MSVYVGIDVHRKRSQVAVLDGSGEVQVNRNVPNGVGSVLSVIGDLPPRTPVAFEAAYGWGWLVELLFRPEIVLDGVLTRVLVEQTSAVDPARLGEHVGHLTFDELRHVDAALRIVLAL